jgi:hypothetical protein
MNNAERILRCLDEHLSKPLELIIYGRASIALGFKSPLPEQISSSDVDAIIPITKLQQLQSNEDFWNAQASTNSALEKDGLFFTHLFTDDDVILREGWEDRKVPIDLNFKNLKLFRPATEDLILTKMMRDDPQDLTDIRFLISREPDVIPKVERAIQEAKVPPISEIQEQFGRVTPKVRKLIQDLSE